MYRREKWLAVLMLGTLLLSGCSADSKTQVVVPKNQKDNTLLARESEGSLAEQIQAPVRYQCDRELDGFHLIANARVIVPQVEGIKLKKIKSRNFTKDDLETIQNVLFQGENFYLFSQDTEAVSEEEMLEDGISFTETEKEDGFFTKTETELAAENSTSDAEKARMSADLFLDKAQQAAPEAPGDYASAQKLLKEFLEGEKTFSYNSREDCTILGDLFEMSAKDTEDWVEREKILSLRNFCESLTYVDVFPNTWEEWKKTSLWNDRSGPYRQGTVVSPDALYYFFINNGKADKENIELRMFRWESEMISRPQAVEWYDIGNSWYDGMNHHEDNLADLDLQQQSNELMERLGFTDVELAEIQDQRAAYWNIDGVGTETSTRCFSYTPVVDGGPITMVENSRDFYMEDDLVNWPYERIYATYGREGLVDFYWSSPAQVEDWHDEYAFLLPFSEIQKIFEEMLASNYSISDMTVNGELTISEVRLGYVKVVSKELLQEDNNRSVEDGGVYYTGVLVPAWDFIGQATDTAAELYGVASGTQISYMTINAMDGSVIQR